MRANFSENGGIMANRRLRLRASLWAATVTAPMSGAALPALGQTSVQDEIDQLKRQLQQEQHDKEVKLLQQQIRNEHDEVKLLQNQIRQLQRKGAIGAKPPVPSRLISTGPISATGAQTFGREFAFGYRNFLLEGEF
jgi:hypothetical protein